MKKAARRNETVGDTEIHSERKLETGFAIAALIA
jgi:hypothetical protein